MQAEDSTPARAAVSATCEHCGGRFTTWPYHNRLARFCRPVCRTAANKARRPPRPRQRAPKEPRVPQTCKGCGASFLAYANQARRGLHKYCSRACWLAHWFRGDTRNCERCGRQFRISPSRRSTQPGRWCSPRCAGAAARRATHRERDGWEAKAWRKAVLERDNHTCQGCGTRVGPLHAHHIRRWGTNPESRYDVGNGRTLCRGCHHDEHASQDKWWGKRRAATVAPRSRARTRQLELF
jgi:5-methylcytosine-specific restriction endonuclease McrA